MSGEKYLRPMLDSGSSRVLNLLDRTLILRQEAARKAATGSRTDSAAASQNEPLFFRTRAPPEARIRA